MWTFTVLVGVNLVNLLYVTLFLQESLVVVTPAPPVASISDNDDDERTTSSPRGFLASCWEPFSRVLSLYVSDTVVKRRTCLQLTAVLLFIVSVVQFGRQQVLWCPDSPFNLLHILISISLIKSIKQIND